MSNTTVKPGYFFLAAGLLAVQAFAQSDAESSELERSLAPQKLQQLVDSREQADEEMRRAGVDTLSPQIFTAFLDPQSSVAIVKTDQLSIPTGGPYELDLSVEKLLRGTLPQRFTAQCYWSADGWPLRPPLGAQRIRPESGKRMLISVHNLADGDKQPRFFQGILDLNDGAEAAFLPQALAAAEMEASAVASGLSAYETGLTSEVSAVRDLALHRLLAAKECPADAHCQESILAESRNLLASKNPNDRMEAVRWLGKLSDAIGVCQIRACGRPQFQRAPVRELLQTSVADKNVAVGDEAFQFLAALDFHQKENAGYCEEIVPAMRTVKRYAAGQKHWIGGSLNASSVCVGPAK